MNTVNLQKKPLADAVLQVIATGELDAHTGPQLRDELTAALDEGTRWVVLDMGAVEYIDSVGLGIIVGAAKRAAMEQGNLAVVAPRPNVLRVFDISGTRELLNVVATVEDARERLAWPEPGCGCEEGEKP
jgi:anti-sigma B factor antagonist